MSIIIMRIIIFCEQKYVENKEKIISHCKKNIFMIGNHNIFSFVKSTNNLCSSDNIILCVSDD